MVMNPMGSQSVANHLRKIQVLGGKKTLSIIPLHCHLRGALKGFFSPAAVVVRDKHVKTTNPK